MKINFSTNQVLMRIVACLAFVAAGFLIMHDMPVIAWIGIIFFGGAGIYFIISFLKMKKSSPVGIEIDNDWFAARRSIGADLEKVPYAWVDHFEIYTISNSKNDSSLTVFLNPMGKQQQGAISTVSKINQKLTKGDLSFVLAGLEMEPAEIVDRLNTALNAWRARN